MSFNGFASAPASNKRRLEGKVAIITGGSSGIGESAVKIFWENGAKIVIADIQDKAGQALAESLGGENVSYIHCDISNEEDIINLVDSTVAKYGHLDIMYNNAGVIDRPFGSILDTTKADLNKVLQVNLGGSFMGAKHAARVMIPQKKGCILFTASASTAIAGLSTHAYTASKYGIVGLSKNLSAELGQHGIRVNCVSPYGVMTNMTPGLSDEMKAHCEIMTSEYGNLKGKILKADDVANAALFLASDDAAYISGLNLVVDGGFSVVNPTTWKALGLIQ
ncbi:tropinone reductase-like 1 [Impatiens glandulifera]|uniref:tropinone reductase-like 1 n=1 Tax=Impatiens glandulifera TaxID=253017 RepID=UPI001FB135FA|nr:tropinone reductase-like 1 [Impatiens glandulifera]